MTNNPSDHTIAARVRAELSEETIEHLARTMDVGSWSSVWPVTESRKRQFRSCVKATIAAYRTMLLADEPPLSDEQISDRSAP